MEKAHIETSRRYYYAGKDAETTKGGAKELASYKLKSVINEYVNNGNYELDVDGPSDNNQFIIDDGNSFQVKVPLRPKTRVTC